jgi:hypothetical protein
MPVYFGYQAHRDHGAPWRQRRSGRQMQQDPNYTVRWHYLKEEAHANGEMARLIDACQRLGYGPREIVDGPRAFCSGPVERSAGPSFFRTSSPAAHPPGKSGYPAR